MSKPTFPLSNNNLEGLVEYVPSAENPESLISKISLPAGSLFTKIIPGSTDSPKAYSTVQVSRDRHVELESALLYMNHSCAPSVNIDTKKMEIRVSSTRDLRAGDHLTFFYPSTEWEMDRPFDCMCGVSDCFGVIRGASAFKKEELNRRGYFINDIILELWQESDGKAKPSS